MKTAIESGGEKAKGVSYSFTTPKSPEEIYHLLLVIDKWWSGLFEEVITGESRKINDEFSFRAGNGAHYSKHRLIELDPNRKIVWKVIESKLSFLTRTDEWVNTALQFDIVKEGEATRVTFTHQGLVPTFECYDRCAGVWSKYMENLEAKWNK